jgi:hypothetical protein
MPGDGAEGRGRERALQVGQRRLVRLDERAVRGARGQHADVALLERVADEGLADCDLAPQREHKVAVVHRDGQHLRSMPQHMVT